MIGIQARQAGDKVVNPYSRNTVVKRDGRFYSVNHYPAGVSRGTGEKLAERFEVRFELVRVSDWAQLQVDPADHGVEFDDRGYVKGYF